MISLDKAKLQVPCTLVSITCPEGECERLQSLGFVTGAPLCVKSCLAGNLIVSVMNSRVALGREQAKSILVEEAHD